MASYVVRMVVRVNGIAFGSVNVAVKVLCSVLGDISAVEMKQYSIALEFRRASDYAKVEKYV